MRKIVGTKFLAVMCYAIAFICIYFGFPDEHAQFGTMAEFVLEASMYSIALLMIILGNKAIRSIPSQAPASQDPDTRSSDPIISVSGSHSTAVGA